MSFNIFLITALILAINLVPIVVAVGVALNLHRRIKVL